MQFDDVAVGVRDLDRPVGHVDEFARIEFVEVTEDGLADQPGMQFGDAVDLAAADGRQPAGEGLRLLQFPQAHPRLEEDFLNTNPAGTIGRTGSTQQAFVELLTTKLIAQEEIAPLLAEKNIAFSDDITFARYSRDFDYKVVEKVFKLAKPAEGQVVHDWVTTSSGDFAVIESCIQNLRSLKGKAMLYINSSKLL